MPRWRTGPLLAVLLSLTVAVAGPARPAVAAAPAGQCTQITSPFAGTPVGDQGVTLRIGCASNSGSLRSLARDDNDLVAALDFDTTGQPAKWQELINRQVEATRADLAGGLSLSQALVKQGRTNAPGLYQAPDNGIDFGGSVQVVGSSIVFVVPASDINVAGFLDGLWKKLAVGLVVAAIAVLVTGLCLGFSAPAAPYAVPVCAALGGGISAGLGELLSAVLDGVPIDETVWGNAAGAAIAGALAGAAAGFATTWLATETTRLLRGVQGTLRGFAVRFYTAALEKVAGMINQDAVDLIRRTIERWQRGIQPSGSLRVMPLGDSITAGVGSPSMNGYRVPLQGELRKAGVTFDFVGSQANGVSTADVQHEGHSGWRIDEIAARLPDWLSLYRPEIVTLHLGTNDMIQNYQTAGAVNRLGGVIDQIFAGAPETTVVVSSLVPSRTAAIDARIRQFNQGLGDMIQRRIDNDRHLIYVNMAMVTTADVADDVHPNDAGYAKMAKTFSLGVFSAFHRGWLDVDVPEAAVCTPGDPGGGGPRRAGFADLNGDGKDDYVAVDPATGSMRTWLNVGADRDGDQWLGCGMTASGTGTGVGLDGRVVDLADLNGDGRDDYLAIDPGTGNVRGWLNNGAHQSGDHWIDRGVIASGSGTGVGNGAREAHFADLDGDGRDDYLAVDPATGSAHAWLNNGAEQGGDRWIDQGIIASGTNTGVSRTGRSVRFGDLNGDRLADYLALDPTNGATHGWLNVGAHVSGDHWLYRGVIASGTNTGVGVIGTLPPAVGFGFASASFADLNGDNRDDYLAVDETTGAVKAWLNDGADQSGNHWTAGGMIATGLGTGVGSGGRVVRWADLDGDGRDDYVAVDPGTGLAQAWLNDGAVTTGDHWIDRGIVASGSNTGAGTDVQIHFADLDGDGRDDYLAVDQRTGAAHLWLNVGADRAGDRWVDQGVIATGTGTGVRADGPQVAFADLDGDGKDDYLAVDPATGAIHAWLNRGAHTTGDHWLDGGVIASGTGTGVATNGRRAHLANLNTDRRADYLAVHPTNGTIHGWLNDGAITAGDHWIGLGSIATGNSTNSGAGN